MLPDLAAGCSMADMATAEQVERAWETLQDAGVADVTVPVSYMNCSAAIKAFTGRHGGTICTSSNAEARAGVGVRRRGERVLFLPDQHLGRNTAVLEMGIPLEDCVVFDPRSPSGGLTPEQLRAAKMLLWKGHCSVHGRFTLDSVRRRARPHPRRAGARPPRMPARGRHRPRTWSAAPNSSCKAIAAAPAGQRVGGRHRAEPGAAAGRSSTRTRLSRSWTVRCASARR